MTTCTVIWLVDTQSCHCLMLHPSPIKLERDQKRLDLLQLHRRQWHQLAMHQAESRRQLMTRHQAEQAELARNQLRYGSVMARQLTELKEWMYTSRLIRDQLRLEQQQELAALLVTGTGD